MHVDKLTDERRAFLNSRLDVLDRVKPINRHFDDGLLVARWKLSLREGVPVSPDILDQLLAEGWQIWDRVKIVRSSYGTPSLQNNSYSSLSLGIDRVETVTVTLDGWLLGSDQRKRNEITLVRNQYSLFHGYFTHSESTIARLAFSVPPLKAQLLYKTAS